MTVFIMKLPFTERFLWDVYNLIEGVQETYTAFSVPSLKDVLYPEMAELRKVYKKRRSKLEFKKFIYSLKKKGILRVKELESKKAVMLTPKGWQRVARIYIKIRKKKKRKDKRWIMVIFDIPERIFRNRNLFRDNLKYLGYSMLQKSIWVCPYDILKETESLARNLNIESFVRILLVEKIVA